VTVSQSRVKPTVARRAAVSPRRQVTTELSA